MSEFQLEKWKGIYWAPTTNGDVLALCPDHRVSLEIQTKYGLTTQDTTSTVPQLHLICPEDNKIFTMNGVQFWMFKRRYTSAKDATNLKSAKIYDLDNVYTPVLRTVPKKKDDDLSIQVEIDKTSDGKKLVIYAADRKDLSRKSHIFIDPQKESTTFDGKDLHPNAIFAKIEITYKSGKKTILDNR
jgi:hypothetical protein